MMHGTENQMSKVDRTPHALGPRRGRPEAKPMRRCRVWSVSTNPFPAHALKNVSLDVYAGEVHVILGQNGAGKSTLIKTLYGAYAADRGYIEIEGRRVAVACPADASAPVSPSPSTSRRSRIWTSRRNTLLVAKPHSVASASSISPWPQPHAPSSISASTYDTHA